MDNVEQHDDLAFTEILGGAAKVRKALLERAWRKKSQAISDAGGYATLSKYEKSLIKMPEYAKVAAAAAGVNANVVENSGAIPATNAQLMDKVKNYLPMIIGVVVIGVIIYMIVKKK